MESSSRLGITLGWTKTSEVPTLTELRVALGFGRESGPRHLFFKKHIKKYAAGFTTKDDAPGETFTRWRDPSHQAVFREMAQGFLNKHGMLFWQDDGDVADRQAYRCSRNREQLLILLAQLFFRQNEQSNKKKASAQSVSISSHGPGATSPEQRDIFPNSDNERTSNNLASVTPPSGRGNTRETAIDIDALDKSPSPPVAGTREDPQVKDESDDELPTLLALTLSPRRGTRNPPQKSSVQELSRGPHAQAVNDTPMADPFDDSHSHGGPANTGDGRDKRPATAEPEENNRPSKAPRHEPGASDEMDIATAHDAALTLARERALIGRTSPRVRQQRRLEDHYQGDEYAAYFRSLSEEAKEAARRERRAFSARKTPGRLPAPMAMMGDNPPGDNGGCSTGAIDNHSSTGDQDAAIRADGRTIASEDGDGDPVEEGDHAPDNSPKQSRSPTPDMEATSQNAEPQDVPPQPTEHPVDEPDPEREPTLEREQSVDLPGEEQHMDIGPSLSPPEDHHRGEKHDVNGLKFDDGMDKKLKKAALIHNIDFTVYNQNGETTSGWTPPGDFFHLSFEGLINALPLKRPRGLSLCLEGHSRNKRFTRTACSQDRFEELQDRIKKMMEDKETLVALQDGDKPDFEIIIEPLK
ncbi:hypothetical protein ACJ41O_002112 [Fusarium nematophilum]